MTHKDLLTPLPSVAGDLGLAEKRSATGRKVMAILRVAGPLFCTLYSLTSLLAGLYLFFYLEQRNAGGTYYTLHTYWERSSLIRMAGGSVGFGGAGLLVTAVSLLVRRHWNGWPGIRVDLAAMAMLQVIGISLFFSTGLVAAQLGMASQVYPTAIMLQRWADESQRFPQNEAELMKIVAHLDAPDYPSPFEQGGRPLPHRHVYINDARGPHLPARPDAEPGVVYCAVNPDAKEFWLTASVLYVPVAKSSAWLKSLDGKVWVMHCELSWKCDPPIPTQ